MSTIFTWQLGPLDVALSENGLQNVVFNVNWRLVAKDGQFAASVYGSIGVPKPDPNNFTPFSDLTEAQVQSWVNEALGAEQIAASQQSLSAQIDRMKNPVDASLPVPWSN